MPTTAYGVNIPAITCRFCKADTLATTATPYPLPPGYNSADEYHASAACLVGDEPSYKMGGPA